MPKARVLPAASSADDRAEAVRHAAESEGVSPVLLATALRLAEESHGRVRRDGFLEALDAAITEYVREPE